MAVARAYYKGTIPENQVFRGQAALILDALAGSVNSETAKTTAAIAGIIKEKLQTRQDPEQVVAFYMSTWKKKGWIRSVEVNSTDSEAATSAAHDDGPHSTQDEVGGMNADELNEARMEAAVEEAAQPQLKDLRGLKLSQATFELLTFKEAPMDVSAIVAMFNSNGYEFTEQQVRSAVQNLLRKELVKEEDGMISIR